MPRYLIERTFPDGITIPVDDSGVETCRGVVARNAEEGVTWVHSYVSEDKRKSYCIYDGPSPEAIRKTASRNDLPVDSITSVRVLDPYFYS
jgi:hypothetical protein